MIVVRRFRFFLSCLIHLRQQKNNKSKVYIFNVLINLIEQYLESMNPIEEQESLKYAGQEEIDLNQPGFFSKKR